MGSRDPNAVNPSRAADERAPDKLRLALEMADTAERMLRQRLVRKHPGASPADVEKLIDVWYATRPGAEWGDTDGPGKTWPRGE